MLMYNNEVLEELNYVVLVYKYTKYLPGHINIYSMHYYEKDISS